MQGLVIREGVDADVEMLLRIEARAAMLLLEHGGHELLAMHSLSTEDLQRGVAAGLLHVAEFDGCAVGFALAGEIDGHAHLFEMDVDPHHGRRGIGSALLASVCDAATAHGYRYITLVTLRAVPWNAPFYARREFVEIGEEGWGRELSALVERERMLGLSPRSRLVMRRTLSFSPGRRWREAPG